MLAISNDLEEFNENVSESSLLKMNTKTTSLIDKLNDLKNYSETAKKGIDTYYNSQNSEKIINKFTKIIELVTTIKSSLKSDLQPILDKSSQLLKKIDKMEKLNDEIDEAENVINYQNSLPFESRDMTSLSNAQETRRNDRTLFNALKSEAKTLLRELKSMDANLDFVNKFSDTDYLAYLDSLQYGTFELRKFTASTGLTVEYYLYVPDYGQSVDGLPVVLYMHGGSARGTSKQGWLDYGLTHYISTKEITPSGIVIMPFIRNFEGDNIEQCLKELTDSVVEEYNANPKKISVSGHSYGGITAYRMVNKYPDYFASCVPISGSLNVTGAFKNTSVWSFNGTSEGGGGNCSISTAEHCVEEIRRIGGKAYMTKLPTGHAGTNKDTFTSEYLSPDGEYINPLEWMFLQELEA